ncbi:MAG TPA: hypothetical protein VM866_11750 [Pyrinomonadaceae bacterium]|nr:hypothetical protein [Pyrinomonadaceae bacterium]
MNKKVVAGLSTLALSIFTAGCADNANTNTATTSINTNNSVVTTNSNLAGGTTASTMATAEVPRTAPDNSEIMMTDAGGVRTETRTFRNPSSRVEKVVVTTHSGGRRTARVHYRTGEQRDLPESRVESALDATGDAIVGFGGAVVDKTKEAASTVREGAAPVVEKVGEGARTVGEKTVEGAKTVGEKTADGARTVGGEAKNVGEKVVDETKSGAKKVGQGAKKVGGAVKDAVTP